VVREVLAQPGPVLCEVFTPAETDVIPTVSSMKLPDGSMRSKPLHEMAPFMDAETLARYAVKDE